MKKNIVLVLSSLILFSCSKYNNTNTNSGSDLIDDSKISSLDTLEANWGKKVDSLKKITEIKNVTYLSYLAFDNSKDSGRFEMFPVLNMHELAGSNEKFNQLVFADGYHDMPSRTYFITNDKNDDKLKSEYVLSDKNLNSGTYITLKNFIKKEFSNFPSKIKILDINSHGNAYKGIAPDITSKSIISIPDLTKAIKDGVNKVNILTLDACLMSSLEVAYELRNVTDIIVASEDNTLETGMNYVKNLPEIIKKSNDNLDELAKNILSKSATSGVTYQYYDKSDNKNDLQLPNVFTMSAIRTKSIDKLAYNLNQLSRMFLNKLSIYKAILKSTFNKTHRFTINASEEDIGQRDAYEVFGRLELEIRHAEEDKIIPKDNEINNFVQKVRENLREIAIRSDIHKSEPWAEGISINIYSKYVNSKEYKELSFSKDNLWNQLIISLG